MNKPSIILLLLLLSTFSMGWAQEDNVWTNRELQSANTARHSEYLSEEEQKVVMLINLARLDGKRFVKSHVMPYLKENNISSRSKYVSSLISDLKKVKNLPTMLPSEQLAESAKYHAIDMGEKGLIGHDSSDGTNCFDRIRRYSKGGYMAENCSYGHHNHKAIHVVMQLLIDEGVPSLGHRKNMLNVNYTAIGVAIQPHKTYGYNSVQDFSDTVD